MLIISLFTLNYRILNVLTNSLDDAANAPCIYKEACIICNICCLTTSLAADGFQGKIKY